uniref:PiggyBac transposable element-derived protein domain-containing protein n=1 Tax=Lepisosteus oculatus TaxID=7918 RepID=W5LV63_LEPOC
RGHLIPTPPPQPARTVQFRFCLAKTPGAQLDASKKYSPLDRFQLFFSVSAVQNLCTNINKNAEKRRAQGIKYEWHPVSIKDMYQFMGIQIFMGLLTSHNMREYWSCQTLHIGDPKEDSPKHDPVFQLRPFLDPLLLACQSFYRPRQNLSVDERMVASKSRIGFRWYMKRKPTKWGIKLFLLTDASTGYTCNFSIYTGRSQFVSGKGLSYDSVMNLLKVSYLGTGYHVYVYSFYSSSALFCDLCRLKFGTCGTIRENRPEFPSTMENALPKRAERGSLCWIGCDELLFTR